MKNILQQMAERLVLPLLILFAMSCEGPEGPAGAQGERGERGEVGEQGPPGEAAEATFAILDFETAEDGWFADGEEGEVGFSVFHPTSIPEIDAEVTANGAVLAFAELFAGDGFNFWTPLPFTLNTGEDYSSHIGYFYSTHSTENPTNFLINSYDTDNLAPTFAGAQFKVRVVILYGEAGSRMNFEELKGISWEELEKILAEL